MLRLALLLAIGVFGFTVVPPTMAAASAPNLQVTTNAPDPGPVEEPVSTTIPDTGPPPSAAPEDQTSTTDGTDETTEVSTDTSTDSSTDTSTDTSTEVSTEVDTDVTAVPSRPSARPQVNDSSIPLGSIALALFVLTSVGVTTYVVLRRSTLTPSADQTGLATAGPRPTRDRPLADSSAPDFLISLGEALIDAGAAVGHIESTLRTVARANGIFGVGVIVLPTALIVSVPDEDDVLTEIGTAGRSQLRLDQIDDVLNLVNEAEAGLITTGEGARRLREIRSSPAPYVPSLVLIGHVLTTIGLAAILHGTWVELVLAALLGACVGRFRLWTRTLSSSYQPFIVLIAATLVSISVFTLSRIVDDLLTFPLLIAPLITFLPGGLLTIAALELATGQIVSGASRLASGGLQLTLLALGIVAGSQLVGVPEAPPSTDAEGLIAVLLPWLGVAVFGVGLVWFHGARSSARVWILLVLYVAYAGQVIGGLFFGSALSAFFGAFAMTPIAILVARKPAAPAPLVTFLPGFWLLVPGALGLDGATRLFGEDSSAATAVFVTTATSMVGVSLGILLGLLLVTNDPERPWSATRVNSS